MFVFYLHYFFIIIIVKYDSIDSLIVFLYLWMHLCAIYETNKDHALGVTSLPTCLFWPITIPYSWISFFKTHPFILCRVIPYYGGEGVELISARFWTFYFLFLPAITPKSLLHLLNISPPPLICILFYFGLFHLIFSVSSAAWRTTNVSTVFNDNTWSFYFKFYPCCWRILDTCSFDRNRSFIPIWGAADIAWLNSTTLR